MRYSYVYNIVHSTDTIMLQLVTAVKEENDNKLMVRYPYQGCQFFLSDHLVINIALYTGTF